MLDILHRLAQTTEPIRSQIRILGTGHEAIHVPYLFLLIPGFGLGVKRAWARGGHVGLRIATSRNPHTFSWCGLFVSIGPQTISTSWQNQLNGDSQAQVEK
jgi:hypothetical protein